MKYAGWDGAVKGNFLDEAGEPIDGTFRQLFIWLYEQDVTKGVFKPMLAWAQAKLNEQRSAKKIDPMDVGGRWPAAIVPRHPRSA